MAFFSTVVKQKFPISTPPNKFCSLSSFPSPSLPSDEKTIITTAVTILKHQRSKSRWTHLRSLFPSGFTPSQVSQITLQLRNNPRLALNFFHFTIQHSLCAHSLSSYSTIIHILARARLKTQAQTLIQSALHKFPDTHLPISPKYPQIFEYLIKSYRLCDSAPFVFDLLIKSCLQAKRIDQSIEIVRMLRSRGIFPLITTCNSLITVVSKCQDCYAGYDMYKEIFGFDAEIDNGIANGKNIVVPNAHTFNIIMLAFHREGLIRNIEVVWDEMARVNCEPNVYSYSVLMAAYCEDERMGEAMRAWEEMRVKNVSHDLVAYNTIIGGFCNIGEVGRAEEFFRQMELNGIESTSVTFEHLIIGYCKIRDIDSALLLYNDMCSKGFRPECSTIGEVIGGLCRMNRISEALDFLRVAIKRHDIVPKGKTYEFIIKGLCQEGKMEEGLKLQAEMVGKGYEPNYEIYNAVIDGYMEQGNEDQAGKLRKEMVEIQVLQESN